MTVKFLEYINTSGLYNSVTGHTHLKVVTVQNSKYKYIIACNDTMLKLYKFYLKISYLEEGRPKDTLTNNNLVTMLPYIYNH